MAPIREIGAGIVEQLALPSGILPPLEASAGLLTPEVTLQGVRPTMSVGR